MLTYVSMRVSPGGFGFPGWTSPIYASSHIGMHLTTEPLSVPLVPAEFYFNDAVLYMNEVLDDTATWTVLAREFIPDSAYRFLQVGNFFADGNYSSIVLDPTADWAASYAYVDMVCVAQQSGVCDLPMNVGNLGRNGVPRTVVFTTELDLDLVRWGIAGQALRAVLFDGLGRAVTELDLSGSANTVKWPLNDLVPGIYYVQIDLRDHSSFSVRSWKATP